MCQKKFKLQSSEIRKIVPDAGACYATDQITVEGKPVGYMYRENPDGEVDFLDSGWRFFSGEESQEYVDQPENTMIYDVNTIANYDPSILDYLNCPPGTALEKIQESNSFRVIEE